MEFRLYLHMLQRGWWIVLLTALSATILALGLILISTPIYRASAQLVVSPNLESYGGDDNSKIINSLIALDKRSIVGTYAEVLNSERIYQEAFVELGYSPQELEAYDVVTVVLPDANVLEIAVEGPDPKLTTMMANQIGKKAIGYISDLYSVYDVNFLDIAQLPTEPVRPQPVRDISLAFALGLLLGGVLAIVREQLRTPLEAFLSRTQVDSESSAYNRRYFNDRLDDTIASSGGGLVSLGLVKLDGITDYLQLLPQPLIQQLMRQITDVIRKEVRGNDLIGRWDVDVFSLLLPYTNGNAAVSTLSRVQHALSQPIRYSPDVDETMSLDPKVGISELTTGDSSRSMIERAEKALEDAWSVDSGIVLIRSER